FAIVALLFSLGLVPVALTRTSQPAPMETARLPLKDLFRLAPTGLIGSLFAGVITGTIYGMAAVYANRIGLTDSQVALFIAAVIIGGALLQWPIGRISDGRDRRYIIILTALFSALFAAGLLLVEQRGLIWLLATTLLFGGFSFSIYSVSVAQTHDRLTADQVLEGTRGLLMVNGAGSALGPIISGLLMAWLGPTGFPIFTIGAALILISLVFWRIWVDEPVPVEERSDYVFTTQTSTAGAELDPRSHEEKEQPEVRGADSHQQEITPPIYEPDPGWEQEYGREQGGRFDQTDTDAFEPPKPTKE
ncbi:MAG TPA: MFS transporter, partial [Halothiobacillaceae bacterium]|nr:MFS transporter [Halothiobacillaceae bacterium]